MFEIQGKVNTALCFAKIAEPEAVAQIQRMCDYELTRNAKIRIMPDVHAGKGCTIGTTMTIVDRAVPNVVGVDIGCGMYTVCLGKGDIDLEKVDAAAHFIPSGQNVWEQKQEDFDFSALYCAPKLKNTGWLANSLGTLGGGNHFMEIDRAADGTQYLVIHSGSRNLGKQTAEYYQNLAIELHRGADVSGEERKAIIRACKEQGRAQDIQKELAAYNERQKNGTSDVPEDLCDLSGEYLEAYLHDVEICQRFARHSREKMAEILLERSGLTGSGAFHTVHNYIDVEERILRKGAIAAHRGEKVLIPINMRDGSILAVGKGNPDWNCSAPHGAGRLLSRTAARNTLNLAEYQKSMEGIYTTSVNLSTIDEAPMAYKSLHDILDVIGDTAEVLDVLKPIYNFKASE